MSVVKKLEAMLKCSEVFKVPKMVILQGKTREEAVEIISAKLTYPVIIKREEGNELQYAHFFYICVNAKAMSVAL